MHDHYHLGVGDSVLDVGCAKGYLLHDLKRQFPDLNMAGVDISKYACEHAHDAVKPYVKIADAVSLTYPDKSFDLVVSINTVSNPRLKACKRAIREVMCVSRKHFFITVHAWKTEEQHENIKRWNLTALTCMHIDERGKLLQSSVTKVTTAGQFLKP